MATATHSRSARFGVFEVDLRAGEPRKAGLRVRLQEQPFQVLAMLLERPGEVVTREELQQRLWPNDALMVQHEITSSEIYALDWEAP